MISPIAPPPPLAPKDMLRNLSVTGESATFYVGSLETPNLERLRVDPNSQPDTGDHLAFMDIILMPSRFPKLRHFEALGEPSLNHIVPFIRGHQNLETIELAFWPNAELFSLMGAQSLAPKSLLSYLHHAKFSCGRVSDWEDVVSDTSQLLSARAQINPSRPFTLEVYDDSGSGADSDDSEFPPELLSLKTVFSTPIRFNLVHPPETEEHRFWDDGM